jgi:pyruvate dehydrogenase E1 component beta subunit
LIVDYDWLPCGVSAEISHIVNNNLYGKLKYKVERLGFKFIPCPTARNLENIFYPNAKDIINKIGKMLNRKFETKKIDLYSHEKKFTGPF